MPDVILTVPGILPQSPDRVKYERPSGDPHGAAALRKWYNVDKIYRNKRRSHLPGISARDGTNPARPEFEILDRFRRKMSGNLGRRIPFPLRSVLE